jgi:hypothetical protein
MTIKPTNSRRKFLATLGAGGAAAAAVALNRQPAEPALKSEGVAPQGKGYQVTEHVRNYYRTAKV